METFTVLSIGMAAALGVMAGVMLLGLDSGVGTPAPAAEGRAGGLGRRAGRHASARDAVRLAGRKD